MGELSLKKKTKYTFVLASVFIIITVAILRVFSVKSSQKINQIPILMYHNITDDPLKTSKIVVTVEKFKRDMNYLEKNGYTAISFRELQDYIEIKSELPEKPVVITFDDGLLGDYKYAYPILKEKHMKATMFVIGDRLTDIANRDNYFGWKEAKEMYRSGFIEIQPHTYNLHNYSETLTQGRGVLPMSSEKEINHYNRFKDDTMNIEKAIKQNIGCNSYVFAYPYGDYNETNERVLKDLGYKITLTTKTAYADISNDLYHLRRINVPYYIELEELLKRYEFSTVKTGKSYTEPYFYDR